MNNKTFFGLLTSTILAGLLLANRTSAQSNNSQPTPHHPNNPTPELQHGMMSRLNQHFIEMMIPHHQDAIDMADLVLIRAKHSELKKLAIAIKQDQSREIQQMRNWYQDWYGKEVPKVAMGMMGNPGMGKGMMAQNSMMMPTDFDALKNASDFDKEFLHQMIPHHQMAVHMAQMVLKHTSRPEIRTLAQSIIDSQTAEIKQMQQWQTTWFQ